MIFHYSGWLNCISKAKQKLTLQKVIARIFPWKPIKTLLLCFCKIARSNIFRSHFYIIIDKFTTFDDERDKRNKWTVEKSDLYDNTTINTQLKATISHFFYSPRYWPTFVFRRPLRHSHFEVQLFHQPLFCSHFEMLLFVLIWRFFEP